MNKANFVYVPRIDWFVIKVDQVEIRDHLSAFGVQNAQREVFYFLTKKPNTIMAPSELSLFLNQPYPMAESTLHQRVRRIRSNIECLQSLVVDIRNISTDEPGYWFKRGLRALVVESWPASFPHAEFFGLSSTSAELSRGIA